MNERIMELAKQAGLYNEMLWDGEPWPTAMSCDECNVAYAMFAELLIRQCAMKANATALDLRNRPELDARKYVGDCILKCFGVEE